MPVEWPFLALSGPEPQGQQGGGAVPDAVFDLAVNRAATVVQATGQADALAAWHARTRFARRVPLADIRAALAGKPGGGTWHWAGGPSGGWHAGRAPFP